MGIKRVVDVSFWTDGKIDDFTPQEKYFMLYLLTNPFSKQLGIYEISIKQVAFHIGYPTETVKSLLERFDQTYNMIRFSKETNEIAILNFLRHSVVKGGKPVEDCIKKDMTLVKNKELIDIVFSHLQGRSDLNETVKKVIEEYFNRNDTDNAIENDNDRTMDESYHESSRKTKVKKSKCFASPSLDDIKSYCKAHSLQVDATKFYNYYAASDWHDSNGNKIKSWQQKLITWKEYSKPIPTLGANGIPINDVPSELDDLF